MQLYHLWSSIVRMCTPFFVHYHAICHTPFGGWLQSSSDTVLILQAVLKRVMTLFIIILIQCNAGTVKYNFCLQRICSSASRTAKRQNIRSCNVNWWILQRIWCNLRRNDIECLGNCSISVPFYLLLVYQIEILCYNILACFKQKSTQPIVPPRPLQAP